MKIIRLLITVVTAALIIAATANVAQANVAKSDNSTHRTEVRTKIVSSEVVNINTADTKTLMTLKGIGKKKAQAIIDYRNQHGSFTSVDGLTNVKGISKKRLTTLLKNNADRITVR